MHAPAAPGKKLFSKVIIAGAGPSGLLLSLFLAEHGIKSLILEAFPYLDTRLRASQYGIPASRVFRKAGLIDDIRKEAIDSFPQITWRRVADGAVIGGIDMSIVKDHEDRMVVLPLGTMIQIMYRHCLERGENGELIDIRFEHKVLDAGQDADKAWVDVGIGSNGLDEETFKSKKRFEADYVIGCDGSKSQVRKSLFGREWRGETFDSQLVVTNLYYDGFDKYGWNGGNYMVDNESWGLIANRGKRGLWRVTLGDQAGLTEEEYLKRREYHFKRMLPGHPDPSQYELGQVNMYKTYNRCVTKMRVGRILLAADAAHVCNPWGGYGCMTACIDVDGLADCLIGYYEGRANEDILDVWSEVRMEKFRKYVDTRSRKNMDRVSKTDPWTVAETDPFLKLLKELSLDDERRKAFILKLTSIEYDFTQHFHTKTHSESV
ncbi:FAD/NAD(P)-binding domain-containing protein [Xylariaceae sp. FL0255]|nr:FAD/NAD(P)-binding domain-containing protein [Xylariaceae sp. FL0255]